jgi:hypothetical protein
MSAAHDVHVLVVLLTILPVVWLAGFAMPAPIGAVFLLPQSVHALFLGCIFQAPHRILCCWTSVPAQLSVACIAPGFGLLGTVGLLFLFQDRQLTPVPHVLRASQQALAKSVGCAVLGGQKGCTALLQCIQEVMLCQVRSHALSRQKLQTLCHTCRLWKNPGYQCSVWIASTPLESSAMLCV